MISYIAARDFNGFQIAVVKGKRHLMRNGNQVKAYALEKVVDDFLLEISSLRAQVSGRIVLTGYNNKNFDIPLLTKECSKIGISLSERFADMDIVCADLYQLLFHNRYTLLPLHDGDLKMTTVYNVLCRAQQAHRHDAIEDAEKLRAIHGKLVGPGFAQTFKTCIFSVFQSPVARQPQLPWRRSVKRQNFEDDIGELQGAQGSSCKKRRT